MVKEVFDALFKKFDVETYPWIKDLEWMVARDIARPEAIEMWKKWSVAAQAKRHKKDEERRKNKQPIRSLEEVQLSDNRD